MDLVVGLDAGGTSTRALVLDLTGRAVGVGRAGGGNPNSHPPERAAAHVGQALREALAGLDAGGVRAGVLGMAGSSKLTDPLVAELYERAWSDAGLRCPLRVVTDCEAAFATASASPDGTALVAGTGSIAARIEGRRLVRTAGGYGWLLGDEGSAFWLGREAVRAALRALEAGELDGLAEAVLALAGVAPGPAAWKRLITAVNAEPPIHLARFAPLVTAHAAEPVAGGIVRRAARVLADLAMAARTPAETTPIVLVGSLVGAPSLGERLRAELAVRTDGPVLVASEGAAGAAWLAAVELLGDDAPRPV
ncbi:N-acetylglucosamine kinase-like BadF-type ATPase [Saccharothrix coeruleofusca]|uniref:N-acetylglucosamine kinase n=1 Tax=Saccharothrix coeruleofusca TaxID=33919 RepID=UPI001AE4946D|nr:BadF/BadG/BcrA/BcrD ATPase family protein [Saccharothrix coeruleofusca]MBP2340443.1 N-acetylglucosamine kinase-like BadF-type ATPase [Saccharothrix coeruleofusca]